MAALVPGCELDGVTDIFPRKVQSRLMTQALRKIHYSLCRSQTIIIFVNQVISSSPSSAPIKENCLIALLALYDWIKLNLLYMHIAYTFCINDIFEINLAILTLLLEECFF